MKKHNIIFILILALLFNNCKNNDDSELIEEEIILTDNIEIYNANIIEDSFVLAVKNGGTEAYILDKSGNKIFNWTFDMSLGNDLELLPDGKLIGLFKTQNPSIGFGGYGGIVKILNSDASTNWEYEYTSENYISHHDVEMLENGNVMFLVWEKKTASVAQSFGVNTTVDIYPEALIEINPNTNQIVWEWHSWDHIIQDLDSNLPNYGILSSSPERINVNYNNSPNGDIMHANGIDLDEERNVIFISINKYSEIWVIDHSTNTQEAATNNGGNYNKGGNLLYRFGNPETYNNPFGNRLFYSNHFPNFLENNVPGAGNLLVYVNGVNIEQSSVFELVIPDIFNLQANTNNEPQVAWSFTHEELFFGRISGAVRLNNGNTLICEGDYGFWEISESGEIAWKFSINEPLTTFWRGYSYEKNSDEILSLGL